MTPKSRSKSRRTTPGRPQQGSTDAQATIVQVACLHFARHGIKGSNNRDIALEAGVTPAMIHYYFKQKDQLHAAVLDKAFSAFTSALAEVKTLETWVRCFHSHLCEKPWLPHLMIREVLPPNGTLRPLFLKQIAPIIFTSIRGFITETARAKKVRRNFDIDRHVVLLMGMLVYPFMALQIAEDLTGRAFDTKMLEGFRDDALKLFLHGITAKQEVL